jgi:hypothetical protein
MKSGEHVNLNPQTFGLLCEPAAQITKADDGIAVVAETWRRWDAKGAVFGQEEEFI